MDTEDTTKKVDEEVTSPEEEIEEEEITPEESAQEIDYDAEIEAEKKRGEPDPEIAAEAFRKRQEKRKEKGEDEEEDDEDKPLTKKELREFLSRERQAIITEAQADRIQAIASSLTDNPKEAELIIARHKNRVFPEGMSLKDQLEEIHAGIAYKRLKSTNSELTRAVKSKETVSKDSASAHRDPMAGTAPKQSADDAAAYKRAGFSYDTTKRIWKKVLPNKKTLFKDPKTKRTWVQ